MSKNGCRVSLFRFYLHSTVVDIPVGTFQKLFPSSPSGTPRAYPDLDSEREREHQREMHPPQIASGSGHIKQDVFEMEHSQSVGGDEERLERLGEMEGLPESVSLFALKARDGWS